MRRQIAYEILKEVLFNGRHAHLVLKGRQLDSQDQAFVSALVYTTLQHSMNLDFQFSDLVDKNLPEEIKLIIKIGLAQHFKMDSIPDYAIVSESVDLAKKRGYTRYSGVVNKVLKVVIERGERPLVGTVLKQASLQHSMPMWILNLLSKQYSETFALDYAAYCQEIKPAYVRLNTLKNTKVDDLLIEDKGDGVLVARPELFRSSFFLDGQGLIQDINSQKVVPYLNLELGNTVLDCCCGPGTKTVQIANELNNTGAITGIELHESRTSATEELLERCDVMNTRVITSDVLDFETDTLFDRILLDAPCSGLGVLSHKHDLRYHIYPEDLDDLVLLQKDMLDHVSKMLKVDGIMVYATCTLNKKENERQIKDFLENHDNYELIHEETCDPVATGGDGFYIAQVKRTC